MVPDKKLNSCDIQLIMGKVFGDDNETLKTPGSPKHKYIYRVYEGLTWPQIIKTTS